MSRGSKIIHITDKKITGSKTKVLEHVTDSGLECALKVFEQLRKTRGIKKTPETLSTFDSWTWSGRTKV